MSDDPQQLPVFHTHLDTDGEDDNELLDEGLDAALLLRQLIMGQERQNELLEDLVEQIGSRDRQRASELSQWKQANPQLADKCRVAADSLSRLQAEFLDQLASEINENLDNFAQGDFLLNEFVDRYGPRLAHLNGVLQVLAQLSRPEDRSSTSH